MIKKLHKNTIFGVLIIFCIGFLLFLPSLGNGFVWDDEEQIVNNTLVHSIANWPKFFGGGAFNSGGTGSLLGVYYKPLMTLGFSALYSIFGNNPFFFHLFSVFLHLANTVIIFLIFKKFFKYHKSLILSLIFLVHPLYSEVVFYAANLQDLLFFFFGSLALLLILSGKEKRSALSKLLITFLLLCSLLSKETGVIFTLVVFLYGSKITSILSISIYTIMRFYVAHIGYDVHQISPIASLPVWQKVLSIPKILWYYLQNLFIPINLVPNQHWVVSSINFGNFWLPLLASCVFLTLLFLLTFKKDGKYLIFLTIFILSIGVHLQIIPLDVTVSGRWFYLPMLGLLGMLGFTKLPLLFKTNDLIDKITKYLPYLVILTLFVITFNRSFDWKDGLSLYSHDTRIVSNDFNLENNLGVELYRIGKISEAKFHFEKSTKLAPTWWTNWNNLGVVTEENNLELARQYYKKAIDNGNYYLAYENYARVLIKQQKFKEANSFLESAVLLFPYNPNLKYFLQRVQQIE